MSVRILQFCFLIEIELLSIVEYFYMNITDYYQLNILSMVHGVQQTRKANLNQSDHLHHFL